MLYLQRTKTPKHYILEVQKLQFWNNFAKWQNVHFAQYIISIHQVTHECQQPRHTRRANHPENPNRAQTLFASETLTPKGYKRLLSYRSRNHGK